QLRQTASVRRMPQELSSRSSIASATFGSVKLGQPVPESNFMPESKSSLPQPAQRYTPSSCLSQYLPVKARSVPPLRSTSYCSGVSSSRHCSSVFRTFVDIWIPFSAPLKGMTVALRITQPDMNKARMQTLGYGALGLALALWLTGDALWVLSDQARGPFPDRADWFWLAGYPAACAGLA